MSAETGFFSGGVGDGRDGGFSFTSRVCVESSAALVARLGEGAGHVGSVLFVELDEGDEGGQLVEFLIDGVSVEDSVSDVSLKVVHDGEEQFTRAGVGRAGSTAQLFEEVRVGEAVAHGSVSTPPESL